MELEVHPADHLGPGHLVGRTDADLALDAEAAGLAKKIGLRRVALNGFEVVEGALDFVYFSVMAYSSLGFSGLQPDGAIRIMAGTEVLVGLTIITWSASLTFLEMQRDWREFGRY